MTKRDTLDGISVRNLTTDGTALGRLFHVDTRPYYPPVLDRVEFGYLTFCHSSRHDAPGLHRQALGRDVEPENEAGRAPKRGRVLLNQFRELASEGDVVSFARMWGPLGLCKQHGLPARHGVGGSLCQRWTDDEGNTFEAASAWLAMAQEFRRVTTTAAELHRSAIPPADTWPIAPHMETSGFSDGEALSHKDALFVVRRRVGSAVDAWLRWSGVRFSAAWSNAECDLVLAASVDALRLSALLSAQLALAVARVGDNRDCRSCGRMLPDGQRKYCLREECKRAAAAVRQRRRRSSSQPPPS